MFFRAVLLYARRFTKFSACFSLFKHLYFLCGRGNPRQSLPLTSCAPASVKSMLITSSKLHPGSDAWLS